MADDLCRICGATDQVTTYEGSIRQGRFGSTAPAPGRVLTCRACGCKWLEQGAIAPHGYEGRSYREEYDGCSDCDAFYRVHDPDQVRHLGFTGTERFRRRAVADVGCGGGSFLDHLRGVASEIVAIEPAEEFRHSLADRGYRTYAYPAEALREYGGRIDVAVSFSVIEHVDDPLEWLREVRALLRVGGELLLSTPNAADVLLDLVPEAFQPFFYRTAHRWYFDARALSALLERAGFASQRVQHHQRFGLANAISWIRERRPRGNVALDFVTPAMDSVWRTELERIGRSDYLFATATRAT